MSRARAAWLVLAASLVSLASLAACKGPSTYIPSSNSAENPSRGNDDDDDDDGDEDDDTPPGPLDGGADGSIVADAADLSDGAVFDPPDAF